MYSIPCHTLMEDLWEGDQYFMTKTTAVIELAQTINGWFCSMVNGQSGWLSPNGLMLTYSPPVGTPNVPQDSLLTVASRLLLLLCPFRYFTSSRCGSLK